MFITTTLPMIFFQALYEQQQKSQLCDEKFARLVVAFVYDVTKDFVLFVLRCEPQRGNEFDPKEMGT